MVVGLLGNSTFSFAFTGRPILAPLDASCQVPTDGIGYHEARCQANTHPTLRLLLAALLRTVERLAAEIVRQPVTVRAKPSECIHFIRLRAAYD